MVEKEIKEEPDRENDNIVLRNLESVDALTNKSDNLSQTISTEQYPNI